MAFDPNAAASPDSGIFGLSGPHSAPETARVVLLAVPWEATTSYRPGTARGPAAIAAASKQVDLFDVETGRPYEAGIALLPEDARVVEWAEEARALAEPIIELGGVPAGDPRARRVDELSAALNEHVHATAQTWLARDKIVGLVGGDHSTPFGLIRAIAERHPGAGILHVDAHADLRPAYEGFADSHASIMYNVAERLPGVARIVQVGIRDLGEIEHDYAKLSRGRVVQFHDLELAKKRDRGASWQVICDEIVARLPKEVYLSFDIDGLDPTLCPHTGTPVPGGLGFHEVCALFRSVVEAGRMIVGFDLNEVAPGPAGSGDDEWDANVGARVLYKMIGWTLRSRSG
jgi:agmatinase